MTSKERVLNAISCQDVDRAPWVPFVGCHAGHLLGVSAEEYLKSEEHIVKGVQTAIDRYSPDGIPVVFDLQVEAETFGCELNWAEENPPAVTTHPLAQGTALSSLTLPEKTDGRIPLILAATRRLRDANPDIALYGLITGPFTLALHLKGTQIFMDMFDSPDDVRELMAFTQQVSQTMAAYYIEAGCDVIAVVDPMTSQIGPDQFRDIVTPYARPLFESIREQGSRGSFFVCGHAQQNIEVMCQCRPDNISVDENIPLDYVRDIALPEGVSFGGNLQLTTVLLLGTERDAQKNAVACLELGGERGYLLAPGCDLPYSTPPANLEAVARVVGDPYEQDVIRTLSEEATAVDVMDMSEYGLADKVIVDVITLDSEACAPCQYMVEAVKAVSPEFEEIVEWREHKIKYRESLVFMTSLMVRNIPTICIDGQITFVSRIPHRDELVAAIQKRIYEKLRLKIQRRRASLYVLGDGGAQTQEAVERVERAVRELGAEVDVQVIEDEKLCLAYGIAPVQRPAIIMARYQVKSVHTVPEVSIVKEWIKDIG